MNEGGITPVMSMNPGYGGFGGFGGEGIWLFAILALMWGGGGFFGNRNADGGRCATVEDLANSANFTRLESQVMNNGNRIEQKADATYSGLCNLGYEIAQQFGQTNRQLSECCCTTQRAIDGVNYNGAINTAAINANTTAQVQKVLDALCADKLAAQAARIQQLELAQAMQGVVRYPSALTYTAGGSPFCGAGTCAGNI